MTTAMQSSIFPLADPEGDSEWNLDVTFVEVGDAVNDLLRLTDDGCGSTCESACTSC